MQQTSHSRAVKDNGLREGFTRRDPAYRALRSRLDAERETPFDEGSREPISWPQGRMFAIAFDLDLAALERHYPGPSHNNGYKEIEDILDIHGFYRQQGSVYFGNEKINSVATIHAAQDLSRCLPWFKDSVRDIRMLRIAENDDLSRVL